MVRRFAHHDPEENLDISLLAGTMFELVKALHDGAEALRERSSNSISLNAGCELFIAFVTLFPHGSDVSLFFFLKLVLVLTNLVSLPQNFVELKTELVKQGQRYATEALTFRMKIAKLALGFIKDDAVVRLSFGFNVSRAKSSGKILTHSYSRVVMKTLLQAHERKRISVYVTEARPRGLGFVKALAPSPLDFLPDSPGSRLTKH